jgi:branched-subunit amino acid transport protein
MPDSLIWLILGMGLATYLPRMLPLVWLRTDGLHPKLQGMLKNVPYAILGALIFPGVLTIKEDNLLFGAAGAAVAFLTAWAGLNVILVVVCSILALVLGSFIL